MSGLTRWEPFRAQWNPWKELEDVEKRLSALGTAPGEGRRTKGSDLGSRMGSLVDITEDDKEYLIKAELPEIKEGGT
ncbi:MAG: hypothetical protein MRJ92_01585 [Nitrospira sp.]|nr:hypothetical protein [Nitrospira sp.]